MAEESKFSPIKDRHGVNHEVGEGTRPVDRATPNLAKQESSSDNQVFSRDEFVSRCGGDAGIAARIAAKFRDRSVSDLDDLQSVIDARSVDSVVQTAHRLKGVAASMAAHRLAERYRELEAQARDGDLSGAPELLKELRMETTMFNDALSAVLGAVITR